MEMNIKYKKKYHKYKNKYYKIIQNNKLTGGGEWVTISAVILSIIFGSLIGTGIIEYKDAIKNWFNLNSERLKQTLLTGEDKRKNANKLADIEFKKEEAEVAGLNEAIAEVREEAALEILIPSESHGLLLTKTQLQIKTITTYYGELELILNETDQITNENYLDENIINVKSIENPITKQKHLHWDFNTRHFYWTPNINNTDKTVYIKYYPRFGDPNYISVYKLKSSTEFELYKGYIDKLLPKKPTISIVKPVDKKLNNTNESKNYLTHLGLEFLYNNIETYKVDEIVKEFLKFMGELTYKDNYEEKYIEHLSEIIDKNMRVEQNIKLTIQKISGDGLCQFYSIIHQLQGKNKKKLENLKNKYNDNQLFKDNLKGAIKDFIQAIINAMNEEGFTNEYDKDFKPEDLAEELKNIMIMFIDEHYNTLMQYCNPQGKQNEEEKITYEDAIKMFNFKDVEEFKQYYGKDKKNWGDDLTLAIIAAIFNLKINLYEKRDDTHIKTTRQPLYLVDENECENPVEIELLYANMSGVKDENVNPLAANHYESVITVTQMTQVTPN